MEISVQQRSRQRILGDRLKELLTLESESLKGQQALGQSWISRVSKEFVNAIKSLGIKVIATDFDLTLITKHSGGHINPVTDRKGILTSLSPHFDIFASVANSKEIPIVVVTFSDKKTIEGNPSRIAGEDLVRMVLQKSNAKFVVEKIYGFYPDNWILPNEYKILKLDQPMPYNKSYHLKKVCEDYSVSLDEILLIDDDLNNCRAANKDGVAVLRVLSNNGFNFHSLSTEF